MSLALNRIRVIDLETAGNGPHDVCEIWLTRRSAGLPGVLAPRRRPWIAPHQPKPVHLAGHDGRQSYLERAGRHGAVLWALSTVIVAAVGVLITKSVGDGTMAGATVHLSNEVVQAAAKATAGFAIVSAIGMVVGAFIACVSAA